MSDRTLAVQAKELAALLDEERAVLLRGELAALEEMLPAKAALVEALSQASGEELAALDGLDSRLRRNQLLLDGAMAGIREVAGRMSALRRTRETLETYGSDGNRRDLGIHAAPAVERRA